MATLNEEQCRVLVSYLGENWQDFVDHCDSSGNSEDEAEELYQALGGDQ